MRRQFHGKALPHDSRYGVHMNPRYRHMSDRLSIDPVRGDEEAGKIKRAPCVTDGLGAVGAEIGPPLVDSSLNGMHPSGGMPILL